MTYTYTPKMRLTHNCLVLSATDAVMATALYKSQIRYTNGCYINIDLLSGIVSYKSIYRKQPRHNKVNDDIKAYRFAPIYFDTPVDCDSNESLYRHARVHILSTFLSEYHRDLYLAALERDAIQRDCDLADAEAYIHHIDCNKHNNAIYNLLPVTRKEHNTIHRALKRDASTYDALVAALGVELVNNIFDVDYFDRGDGGVFTASISGENYIQRMLSQLSVANLPTDTKFLKVKTLHNKYLEVDITNMTIYQILSALYTKRAITILY